MEGYSAKITYSSKELTLREKIKYKDMGNAVKLEEATAECPLVIPYGFHLIVSVHNEHSKDDKDYDKIVVVDTAGTAYQTGSTAFQSALESLIDDFKDAGEDIEGTDIEVCRMPSKNREGKFFITCRLA